MNIGIIGSGNVGGTLGTRWAKGGHQVIFGSRDPGAGDMKELLARAGSNARGAKLQDAAKSGDVLLLAMPWPVTKEVVQGLGDLTGKILIDATNPVLPDLSGLALGHDHFRRRAGGRLGARRQSSKGIQHRRLQHHGESGIRSGKTGAIFLRRRRRREGQRSNNWPASWVSKASMPGR